jgi:hypothetical protein
MGSDKESKKFTRRQFVKGALGLGVGALIGPGCQPDQPPSSQPEKPTDPTPTSTKEASPTLQSPTATKEPTAAPTPEVTSTPEAKLVAGLDITKDYLEKAFTGIGGGETIDNGQEEVSFVRFGQDYVGQSWGEEAAFASLSEDPIVSIKYLISLGAYQGRLGLYSPGKEGEETIFPGLVEDKEGQEKPLNLLRLELANLPSKDEEKDDYSEWVFPQGLRLEKGTQMTVLGHLEQDQEDKLVIDQGEEETKLHYAVVAFTDYNRASPDGVPRHYLALIPTHLPADPDNQQALTLANLLTLNGYDYDPAQKAIAFTDPKTKEDTTWQLNKFVGQDFHQDLFRAAGLAFVDQINDDQIRNPILPYPQGVQDRYQLEREDNQFLFTGQDQTGEEVTLKAAYDQEEETWEWEEVGVPEIAKEEILSISGLDLEWNNKEGRWEYLDPDDGLVAGYWSVEKNRFELLADEIRGEWVGLWVEADNSVTSEVAEDLKQGKYSWLVNFDIVGGGGRIREVLAKLSKKPGSTWLVVYDLEPGIEFKTPFEALMFDSGGTFWGEKVKAVNIKPDHDALGIFFDDINPNDYIYSGFSVPEGTVFYRSNLHYIDPRIGMSIAERNSGDDFPNKFLKSLQIIIRAKKDTGNFDNSLSLADLARNPQGLFYYLK